MRHLQGKWEHKRGREISFAGVGKKIDKSLWIFNGLAPLFLESGCRMGRSTTIICLLLFSLSGCSFYDDFAVSKRRQAYLYNHPDAKYYVRIAIMYGEILIGMTQEQVTASWGRPQRVKRHVYSFGIYEQWIYNSWYLNFKNGILTSRKIKK